MLDKQVVSLLAKHGYPLVLIAERFGVTKGRISQIVKRRSYRRNEIEKITSDGNTCEMCLEKKAKEAVLPLGLKKPIRLCTTCASKLSGLNKFKSSS